jgi:starch synthase
MYSKLGYTHPKVVFTIHNMEYQGQCHPYNLDYIGLDGNALLAPEKMQDPTHADTINQLKGGMVYSDFFTTVSPNYAKEVLTPEGGRGLEKTILANQNKFKGILNGIDYSYWNPEIDRFLPAHFSPREMPENKKDRNTLDKKAFIKKVLRERLLLSENHKPIVSCIARLVPQKGLHLIKHAIQFTLSRGGQFILLGSSPIPSIAAEFQELKNFYSSNPDVHLALHHQEDLAHQIFAGADMMIVPSLFEPCGLTQMIALKYGTVPIVRRTGGLADTIFDVDFSKKPFEKTNGYTFDSPDNAGIESALGRAIDCWFHDPDKWRHLMIQGMKIDFSWNLPADEYLKIYQTISGNSPSGNSTNTVEPKGPR